MARTCGGLTTEPRREQHPNLAGNDLETANTRGKRLVETLDKEHNRVDQS